MLFLLDNLQLIKNVQNNWIIESCQELDFDAYGEKKTTKCDDIKALHNLEANQTMKLLNFGKL